MLFAGSQRSQRSQQPFAIFITLAYKCLSYHAATCDQHTFCIAYLSYLLKPHLNVLSDSNFNIDFSLQNALPVTLSHPIPSKYIFPLCQTYSITTSPLPPFQSSSVCFHPSVKKPRYLRHNNRSFIYLPHRSARKHLTLRGIAEQVYPVSRL